MSLFLCFYFRFCTQMICIGSHTAPRAALKASESCRSHLPSIGSAGRHGLLVNHPARAARPSTRWWSDWWLRGRTDVSVQLLRPAKLRRTQLPVNGSQWRRQTTQAALYRRRTARRAVSNPQQIEEIQVEHYDRPTGNKLCAFSHDTLTIEEFCWQHHHRLAVAKLLKSRMWDNFGGK